MSERERFYIEARYYDSVTAEIEKAIKVYELWAQTYPRDHVPRNNLGVEYEDLGELDKAVEAYRDSYRLNSANALALTNVASSSIGLNRLADAKAAADQAMTRFPNMGLQRFIVACIERDAATMAELLQRGRTKGIIEDLQGAFLCAIRARAAGRRAGVAGPVRGSRRRRARGRRVAAR